MIARRVEPQITKVCVERAPAIARVNSIVNLLQRRAKCVDPAQHARESDHIRPRPASSDDGLWQFVAVQFRVNEGTPGRLEVTTIDVYHQHCIYAKVPREAAAAARAIAN